MMLVIYGIETLSVVLKTIGQYECQSTHTKGCKGQSLCIVLLITFVNNEDLKNNGMTEYN